MLLGKNRRWDQDSHLLAALHGEECCPQSHFSLTVPYIATHQAIHRLVAAQVSNDIFYGSLLATGFLKWKAGDKLFIFFPLRWHWGALQTGASGMDFEEFTGHRLDQFSGFAFNLFPTLSTES